MLARIYRQGFETINLNRNPPDLQSYVLACGLPGLEPSPLKSMSVNNYSWNWSYALHGVSARKSNTKPAST